MAECVNDSLCNKNFSADGAMLAFRKTGFGAGGSDCFINNFGMRKFFFYFGFSAEFSFANGTIYYRIIGTFGGTGCVFVVFNYSFAFGMTECINNGLFNKDFSADGAMLAFRKTGFGTSRCNCFVDYFGVRKFFFYLGFSAEFSFANGTIYYRIIGTFGGTGCVFVVFDYSFAFGMTEFFNFSFYSAKFFAADFAVNHRFIGTFFGTGRFHCVFDYDLAFGMAECINNGLCNKNLSANGAMLAFRKSGFGAGGGDCFVDYFGMRKFFFYFGFSAEFSFANGTIYYRIIGTFGGTGCIFVVFNYSFAFGVTQFFDFSFYSAKFFAADFAVNYRFVRTFFRAGGFYCVFDYDLAFGMAECVNDSLRNKDFSANGAMLAFRKTGFGTSRCNCFVDYFGMTQFFDFSFYSAKFFAADFAVNHRFIGTFFGTGRFHCVFDYDLALGMTECINNGLCNKNFTADGAMLAFRKSGFGTGRCDCFVDYLCMAKGFCFSGFGIITVFTLSAFFPFFRTGCFCYSIPIFKAVRFDIQFSADIIKLDFIIASVIYCLSGGAYGRGIRTGF